jgi:hypothetical protein
MATEPMLNVASVPLRLFHCPYSEQISCVLYTSYLQFRLADLIP